VPLLGLTVVPSFTTAANPNTVKMAEDYLVGQYNPTVGLLSEQSGSSTYWLYSDNYLAVLAMQAANGSSPSTQAMLAQNVSSTLHRYIDEIPGALNQYMVLTSNSSDFNAPSSYQVATVGGASIKIALNNGSGTLSLDNYADIAFLEALYYNRTGQNVEAACLFDTGANMYNGVGINDSVYSDPASSSYHQYQTYKLALYLLAGKTLGQSVPPSVEAVLLKMQDNTTGGFYTGYDSSYSPAGTTENVETTSLAILALTAPTEALSTSSCSSVFNWLAYLAVVLGFFILVAATTTFAYYRMGARARPQRP
jgi:hypothetical protein